MFKDSCSCNVLILKNLLLICTWSKVVVFFMVKCWNTETDFGVPPSAATLTPDCTNVCVYVWRQSHSQDQNITIQPASKRRRRCTVVLHSSDYHNRMTTLLSGNYTYEVLRREPTNNYSVAYDSLKREKPLTTLLRTVFTLEKLLHAFMYLWTAAEECHGLPGVAKPFHGGSGK